jgi:NTP pyrophosphatase (non-canonical NTP hydrolase)
VADSYDVTLAQAERLHVLVEEAGEVIQAATKILRHGWNANGHENRIGLEHELGDLQWATGLLLKHDEVWQSSIDRFAADKPAKASRWLHHQEDAPDGF